MRLPFIGNSHVAPRSTLIGTATAVKTTIPLCALHIRIIIHWPKTLHRFDRLAPAFFFFFSVSDLEPFIARADSFIACSAWRPLSFFRILFRCVHRIGTHLIHRDRRLGILRTDKHLIIWLSLRERVRCIIRTLVGRICLASTIVNIIRHFGRTSAARLFEYAKTQQGLIISWAVCTRARTPS